MPDLYIKRGQACRKQVFDFVDEWSRANKTTMFSTQWT